MTIVVHKYGGSSVATPKQIQWVADRTVEARKRGEVPVVVVSAMGRTTDALLALAEQVSPNPHRRELDMILTAGERVSMALLAMAIADRGYEAVSFTGSQAGIITTTDHNQARIIEVRPTRVREALAQGKVVIVGGFAGVSTDKEVTTLGRGGSDTTAIALAAALGAGRCDIFSDVDGVYTADPKLVEQAERIDRLAAGEILELGLRGARVLAPEAVDYARRHGIELHAQATHGQGGGTVVTTSPRPGTGRAVAVTADLHALPLWMEGPDSTIQEALDQLTEAQLRWQDLRMRRRADLLIAELLLNTRNAPNLEPVLDSLGELVARGGGQLQARADEATVTVVGEGIAEQQRSWEIARDCLATLGIDATAIDGSAWGLTARVPRESVDQVVRAWHAAFPGLGESPADEG
ncbi:MAG: aspartate kinase [Deltaproteobacteria bacterium]|nr:aspartate kinase [Deltaproteobacteria bacterium]